jgi:hypothetical protein
MTKRKPGDKKLLRTEQDEERAPSPKANQLPVRAGNLRLFKA